MFCNELSLRACFRSRERQGVSRVPEAQGGFNQDLGGGRGEGWRCFLSLTRKDLQAQVGGGQAGQAPLPAQDLALDIHLRRHRDPVHVRQHRALLRRCLDGTLQTWMFIIHLGQRQDTNNYGRCDLGVAAARR